MFHIKNDKRARKSAELVVNAFDECLKSHDFENMTITELCNASTISRATFYRLFDDLEDVAAYKCELFAEEFSEAFKQCSIEEMQAAFFSEWMKNVELLKLIVRLRRTDIIYNCHRSHLDQVKEKMELLGIEDEITDYHLAMLTYILVGALTVWCDHDCRETPEELVASTKKSIADIGVFFDGRLSSVRLQSGRQK